MGASSGLKKVMPHPMLRTKQQSGSELPTFLNSSGNGGTGGNVSNTSNKKVIITKMRNSQLEKSSCNVSASQNNMTANESTNGPTCAQKQLKSKSSNSLGPSGLQRNSLQKQFESMEGGNDKTQVHETKSDISSNFVVHTLTTANQRD